MKKIAIATILFFILLILMPQVLAICYPVEEGYHCYQNNPEPYNSTRPIIHVEFKEKPVTVNEPNGYTLCSYNTSLCKELNETLHIFRGGTYSEYKYQPVSHLEDADFLFFLNATDEDNNIMLLFINFSIDTDNIKIWVDEPRSVQLNGNQEERKSQNFAVGQTKEFPLQLQLERPATCAYSIHEPIGELDELYENYTSFGNIFDEVLGDEYKARIDNFSMEIIEKGYKNNGKLIPIYIICKEIGLEKYAVKTINVGSDGTAPIIDVVRTPGTITDYSTPQTNFSIKTDDKSVCGTKHINPKDGIIINGAYGITRSHLYTGKSPLDFYFQYEEGIRFPKSQPKNEFQFNVTCQNMANRTSSKIVSVTTDLDDAQSINLVYPNKIMNTSKFDLNITVNFGDSICEYAIDKEDSAYKSFTKTETYVDERKVHTATLASISHGEHKVYIKCQGLADPEEFEIKVDLNKPNAPNVITSDNTCSLKEISFSINGTDGNIKNKDVYESGIKRFHYNITYDDEKYEDDYEEGSVSATKNKAYVEEKMPLGIDAGTSVKIEVRAEDDAGNVGSYGYETVLVSNSSIPECDFVAPDITVKTSQDKDTNEWTINVSCKDNKGGSGCKETFDYSTHVLANESCTYSQTGKNYDDPIFISESVKFCAIVYDKNNNNDTYKKELTFEYPLSCSNGLKDGKETDLDCGGDCAGCAIDEICKKNTDCADNYCAPNKTCQLPSCSDKIKNGKETGVDCGGIEAGSGCNTCDVGVACKVDKDCSSKNCYDDICEEATCDDAKLDGAETDFDCGGPDCEPCKDGGKCEIDSDCELHYDCNQADGTCWLARDYDSDNDGLPDWWELENFGCATCADPNEDSDGDGYTNLEEFNSGTDPRNEDDVPDFYKPNWLGIIIVIVGALSLIAGIILIVMENLKRKNQEQETQDQAFQDALAGTPRPIMLKATQPEIIKPKYSRAEEKLREQHRLNSLKDRKSKRREIFNEFTESNDLEPKKIPEEKIVPPQKKQETLVPSQKRENSTTTKGKIKNNTKK